jgi:hypothetical protein
MWFSTTATAYTLVGRAFGSKHTLSRLLEEVKAKVAWTTLSCSDKKKIKSKIYDRFSNQQRLGLQELSQFRTHKSISKRLAKSFSKNKFSYY